MSESEIILSYLISEFNKSRVSKSNEVTQTETYTDIENESSQ